MSNRVKEVNGTGNAAPGGPKQPEMVFNSTTGQLKTDEQEKKIMFSKKVQREKERKVQTCESWSNSKARNYTEKNLQQ